MTNYALLPETHDLFNIVHGAQHIWEKTCGAVAAPDEEDDIPHPLSELLGDGPTSPAVTGTTRLIAAVVESRAGTEAEPYLYHNDRLLPISFALVDVDPVDVALTGHGLDLCTWALPPHPPGNRVTPREMIEDAADLHGHLSTRDRPFNDLRWLQRCLALPRTPDVRALARHIVSGPGSISRRDLTDQHYQTYCQLFRHLTAIAPLVPPRWNPKTQLPREPERSESTYTVTDTAARRNAAAADQPDAT